MEGHGSEDVSKLRSLAFALGKFIHQKEEDVSKVQMIRFDWDPVKGEEPVAMRVAIFGQAGKLLHTVEAVKAYVEEQAGRYFVDVEVLAITTVTVFQYKRSIAVTMLVDDSACKAMVRVMDATGAIVFPRAAWRRAAMATG